MTANTQERTMNDFSTRIAAGAAWLDEHRPGWVERVDVETLDLGVCEDCIIGQLDGSFNEPANGIPRDWSGASEAWAEPRGFCLPGACWNSNDYRALTDQWRAFILARRAEVTP